MMDKPIIFSAPMVRALLDGRKTQTRRVLKPQLGSKIASAFEVFPGKWRFFDEKGYRVHQSLILPYAPGDRLWVREACALWTGAHRDVVYRASVTDDEWAALRHDAALGFWTTRSPIYMPRWASRITLTVTDVRVQRVQGISEADAMAEGIDRLHGSNGPNHFSREIDGAGWMNAPTAQGVFADLWNSIHGPEAWAANPWVAAISFTVHRGNIDQ